VLGQHDEVQPSIRSKLATFPPSGSVVVICSTSLAICIKAPPIGSLDPSSEICGVTQRHGPIALLVRGCAHQDSSISQLHQHSIMGERSPSAACGRRSDGQTLQILPRSPRMPIVHSRSETYEVCCSIPFLAAAVAPTQPKSPDQTNRRVGRYSSLSLRWCGGSQSTSCFVAHSSKRSKPSRPASSMISASMAPTAS